MVVLVVSFCRFWLWPWWWTANKRDHDSLTQLEYARIQS